MKLRRLLFVGVGGLLLLLLIVALVLVSRVQGLRRLSDRSFPAPAIGAPDVGAALPDTNPFDIRVNPFQSYRNPFQE